MTKQNKQQPDQTEARIKNANLLTSIEQIKEKSNKEKPNRWKVW